MFTSSNLVIMEIACTISSYDLFKARQAYQAPYKKSLEEDIAPHTSGDFRKLLVLLVTSFRYEGEERWTWRWEIRRLSYFKEKCDQAYTDEDLIRILTMRSKAQLDATLNHYNDLFGNTITKDLKADPDNKYLTLLRATIKCLTCSERYYEKTLRLAMKGLGTDENALTRVVVTQAEVNLQRIKEEYHRRSSVTLEHAISGDTSGDYKKFLLALVE